MLQNKSLETKTADGSPVEITTIIRSDCPLETGRVSDRLFPCKTDEEVRLALEKLLHTPCVEVAGGIVRHHGHW
jgi:hypothetical protein